MASITPELGTMALDILRIASTEGLLSKFYADSLARPIFPGQSHQDRVRILEELLREECVVIEGDILRLAPGRVPDWLTLCVSQGFIEAKEVETFLLDSPQSRKKFDSELLSQIGLKGEVDFITWLQSKFPSLGINHVSLFDDSLGYDVEAYDEEGTKFCFEVKSSTKVRDEFVFYVSKNELEVGKQKGPEWMIVCMGISNGHSDVLGALQFRDLAELLPENKSEQVLWQTLMCTVKVRNLRPILFS